MERPKLKDWKLPMAAIKLGLVGVGKIARDQHFPAIHANPDFDLVAVASRHATVDGVPSFHDVTEMLAAHPEIEAVSICTPPQSRHDIARFVLEGGRHVMMEKPPGATVTEVHDLIDLACRRDLALMATWHSRYAPAVIPAKEWISQRRLRSVHVTWREDVRHWHPGQDWVWEAGGLGVFDPGINALSIITAILPYPLIMQEATLDFPSNRHSPVTAALSMKDVKGLPVTADFHWLQTGPQTWDIRVEAEDGVLTLSRGGAVMAIDGVPQVEQKEQEYPGLYRRFAQLVPNSGIDADMAPMHLVADAFLRGERRTVDAFHW
jgi:predicted dehydrogenase